MRLDDELRKDLDREYIRRDECSDNMAQQDKKFANDNARLSVIESYQKLTFGVLVANIVLSWFKGGF